MLMPSRRLIAIATAVALFAVPATAQANVLDALYAPLHIHSKGLPSPSFIRSHFPTVTVTAGELKHGYRSAHTGLYTKGTRSADGHFPESWYLHTAGGARVRDRARGFYVMDPSSNGWRQHVVDTCKASPDFCFLDAMGTDGYDRTKVRPRQSLSWWIQQTTAEANYVENASSRWGVVANNLITARNPKFRVGFEMFGRVSGKKSLDVLEHTQCLCYAKFGTESSAKYGFTLFLVGQGQGDRISVGSDTQAGKWWSFYDSAKKLGSAVAPAKVSGNLVTRKYQGGTVVVNIGSKTARLGSRLARRTSRDTVKAHHGRIILKKH
jgi:hypothetical protein